MSLEALSKTAASPVVLVVALPAIPLSIMARVGTRPNPRIASQVLRGQGMTLRTVGFLGIRGCWSDAGKSVPACGCDPQMRRIDTRCHSAEVVNDQAIRNRPDGQFPCQTVSGNTLRAVAVHSEHAIAVPPMERPEEAPIGVMGQAGDDAKEPGMLTRSEFFQCKHVATSCNSSERKSGRPLRLRYSGMTLAPLAFYTIPRLRAALGGGQ